MGDPRELTNLTASHHRGEVSDITMAGGGDGC